MTFYIRIEIEFESLNLNIFMYTLCTSPGICGGAVVQVFVVVYCLPCV
jgi:hypothetical protein